MSCTTGNDWALSRGNDFRAEVTLDVAHPTQAGTRIPSTGLTDLVCWWSVTRGGEGIEDSQSEMSELSGSPGTYRAILDAELVDELIDLGHPRLWLAVELPGDLLIWYSVPVIRDRTGA